MSKRINTLKHFDEVDRVSPKIYYHYTSLEALFSIISSRTFRLTSLRSSNDKKELSYSLDQFSRTFSSLCESEQDSDRKEILCAFRKGMTENYATFKHNCKNTSKPYALCLSKKKDNLTHWDRYAANCKGVCIGINTASIDVHYKRMAAQTFTSDLFKVGSVIYRSEEIKERILKETMRIYQIISETGSDVTTETPDAIIKDRGFYFLCSVYRNLSTFVKNPSFIDEDEVRMYFDTNTIAQTLHLLELLSESSPDIKTMVEESKESYLQIVKDLGVEKENFMITKNGIRSYRNLYLDKVWGSGTITEIVLGPMCVQNKNELKAFLNANELQSTQISVSKVPIR